MLPTAVTFRSICCQAWADTTRSATITIFSFTIAMRSWSMPSRDGRCSRTSTPVWRDFGSVVFLDAGNVAPTVRRLNLDKTSYGAGVRVHTERATIARFDVAYGARGWELMFRTSDSLRLGRGRRRVASIPFTP